MELGEVKEARLQADLATTPEKIAAWFERWHRDLLNELEDWITGENSPTDYDF